MYHCALRAGMITVGILLTWSLGCQSETHHGTPGALPIGLTEDPNPRLNASTYFAHAHLLERQGNFEQAAHQYRLALELSPDFLSAHNRLGITLNKLRQHRAACAEFGQAIRLEPAKAYLYNNLGFSLYLDGRYEEAQETLACAIELEPDFRRARMNQGVVLTRLERYDEALAQFRLATSEADAHYNMAVAYTDAQKFAKAARSLETALQLNPNFEAAREQLRVVSLLAAEAAETALAAKAKEQAAEAALAAKAKEQPAATAEANPKADNRPTPTLARRGPLATARTPRLRKIPPTIARRPNPWPDGGFVGPLAPPQCTLQSPDQAKLSVLIHALVAAAADDHKTQYADVRSQLDEHLTDMKVGK